MPKRLRAVDSHDGNVVLIFPEQLRIRFDIHFFKRETIVNPRAQDRVLRFVAQVTAGS